MAAGDALGGAAIAITVTTGGRLALQKGNEVVGLIDDSLGQLARVETDIGSLFRARDGSLYRLSSTGSLVPKTASLSAGGNKSISEILSGAGLQVSEYTPGGAILGQSELYTCVAASCRMIANDHGVVVAEDVIAEMLETTMNGVDLIKAAENLGRIGTKGAQGNRQASIAELEAAVAGGRSAIVSVQVPGLGNHAIVVDRIAGGMVYFRDPMKIREGSSGAIGIADFKFLFGSAGKLVSF